MKSKKLVISEKRALELYPNASIDLKVILEETFGKEFFNKKITDVVYNEETLAKYLGVELSKLLPYPINTEDKQELYLNTCVILPKIAKVYNEGKVLDWLNTSEYKYLAYIHFSGSGSGVVHFLGWRVSLSCPCGFYLKTEQLSKDAYNNFKKYYEVFWSYQA